LPVSRTNFSTLKKKTAQIKFNGTGKDDIVDPLASLQSLQFVKRIN